MTDALFSETLMDDAREWIETEATAAHALALTLADADHARQTLDAASERAFALAEKQARQTYNTAAEAANATRAAADEAVELTRQQEGWEAYRTYSAAESNAEVVRTSAREAAQVAFKQATSAAELVYTEEVGEAQVTRREVEALAQRDFVVASKQAMPQQAVARLEQEITTAQNSAASTFANVQPLAHLQTESQKRDRAWNEGDWATWLNQWMDSWTDGGWSAVVSSPQFGQILDAVDGFQAGFWNAMSFGLTTRIRSGLWGELAERNHHGFWFNLGTGVGTVAVIGLGMANPCGMSSLVMGGWRAYNGMQIFGGVLNAHDNFSQGHYFWGALDVVGVMFSTSQLLKACFAAGTPIRTADGSKPVENIVAGDYVLSRDENDPNGPILLKVVEETFVRTGRIWVLRIDGRDIRTTSEHPFYARGKGWTTVAELTTNDVLLAEDGRWLPVEGVEDTGGYETVYNFRVADFHTYFIGGDSWNWSVWAHNAYKGFRKIVKHHLKDLTKEERREIISEAYALAKAGKVREAKKKCFVRQVFRKMLSTKPWDA